MARHCSPRSRTRPEVFARSAPLVAPLLRRYGYGIAEETTGVLTLEGAALHQGPHRMESKGWIEAEWGTTVPEA